ncbi:MAG: glucose-6-phosphate dehydrogenase assembly protein OpcA [Isosphaeraceae bacterium]|nr:glucose-6-phosphate dehydrogenase assembly protein OpcA [Isosphaeraceae bacterium]
MSAPEAPRVVSHAARPVDLDAIEVALKQLWKLPGSEPTAEDAHLRACMANLLIYCATGCDTGNLTDELDVIVRVQPSRVLLLIGGDETLGNAVTAEVSARCHLGGEGHPICSEQITVTAARGASGRLASTARPLLVGDLPTSLWWISDVPPPLGGEVFSALRAMADQVIYSSDLWPDPVSGTIAVAGWVAGRPTVRPAVTDLAWRRLKPWRRLVSQTLDPAALLDALDRLDRIEVEHGSHGLPQAWLLTGWMASRLGWHAQGGMVHAGPDAVWTFRAPHGTVEIRIRRMPHGETGIQRLRVGWTRDESRHEVTFAPTGDGRLSATSPVLGEEPRTLILPSCTRAALVAAELQELVPDLAFREALGVTLAMAESFTT